MPVLGDLYEVLKESQETRRLANIINRLVNGSAKTFNQQTNVSLDNKYIVLDISELTGDLLSIIAVLKTYCRRPNTHYPVSWPSARFSSS